MNSINVLILVCCIGVAFGSNCQNLSGLWRNQLGSNMTIIHRTETTITGEFSTAVESRYNAAVVASNITGVFQAMDEGALLSFTVLFNRGKSLTTWVGQCLVCDGEEILFTTWALKSYTQKRSDRWMDTRVNEDTFTRVLGYENVPHHLRVMGPLPKDERSPRCEKNIKAGIDGKWVAENGDVLGFDECYESGIFSGLNQNNGIVGRSDGGEPFTALGYVSGSVTTIRGWAGHIYEGLSERVIDTVWLSHSFSNNCKDPRRDLRLGMTNYTFDTNFGESSGNSVWQTLLSYVRS